MPAQGAARGSAEESNIASGRALPYPRQKTHAAEAAPSSVFLRTHSAASSQSQLLLQNKYSITRVIQGVASPKSPFPYTFSYLVFCMKPFPHFTPEGLSLIGGKPIHEGAVPLQLTLQPQCRCPPATRGGLLLLVFQPILSACPACFVAGLSYTYEGGLAARVARMRWCSLLHLSSFCHGNLISRTNKLFPSIPTASSLPLAPLFL